MPDHYTTGLVTALKLAAQGIPVFPCNPEDKTPRVHGGFYSATTHEYTINRWWEDRPDALVTIPTGAVSGHVVMDIDRHSEAKDGFRALKAIEEKYGKLPETLTVRTPGGGMHLHFRAPPDVQIKCSAGVVGLGIDMRGEGGYIFVPSNGGYITEKNIPMAEMPAWLIEKTKKEEVAAVLGDAYTHTIEGNRNDTLTSMAGMMRRQGFEHASIENALLCENRLRCVPPLDDAEVRTIAKSVSRYSPTPALVPFVQSDLIWYNAQAKQTGTFGLMGMKEILGSLTGPDYLIKPYLEKGTIGVMYGQSGAYKSFVALDMALCVAYGISYHGAPVHQGPVVYICGEGRDGIKRRVAAWCEAHGKLDDDSAPFYLSTIPAALMNEDNAEFIANTVAARHIDPDLIFIDTLSTNFGEGEENSNGDIALFLKNIGLHFRDRFKACIQVVHHTGHMNGKGKDARERGGYAIRANADTSIHIQKHNDGCALESKKVKDGEEFETVGFKAKKVIVPGITDSEGGVVRSIVLEFVTRSPMEAPTQREESAVEILSDMYDEKVKSSNKHPSLITVTTTEWLDRCVKTRLITSKKGEDPTKTAGNLRSAKSKLKASMLKKGLVIIDENKVVRLPPEEDY